MSTSSQSSQIWERCATLGIRFRADGDQLRCNAPRGSLDAELRELIASNKAGILEVLAAKEVASTTTQVIEFNDRATSDIRVDINEAEKPPWPPRDPRLALWPIPRRERWGRRANELEDTGMRWQEAERRAFLEVLAETSAHS